MRRLTKKSLSLAMALIMALGTITPLTLLANPEINVTINGQQVIFQDQAPAIVDGRTLVPVRGVFEALGFEVGWDGALQQVTLASDNYVVTLTVGSYIFTTNGEEFSLDVPAQIIGGSTMLPIRAVLESVGYYVGWNSATQAVQIDSRGTPIPAQIRNIIGVDGVILPWGYFQAFTQPAGAVNRWQFLELNESLDLNNFTAYQGIPWIYVYTFGSQAGDAFILRFHWRNQQALLIDLGEGAFHVEWLHGNIELNPQESVDINILNPPWPLFEQYSAEHLARFNMSRHLTTDNFHFYSTDENAVWLQDMANFLEDVALPKLVDIFGFWPTQHVSVWYYDENTYGEIYTYLDDFVQHSGYSGAALIAYRVNRYAFRMMRPSGSTILSDMFKGILVHELVHKFQGTLMYWDEMARLGRFEMIIWVIEGTATFLDGSMQNSYVRGMVARYVRSDNIPTLDYLEDDFYAGGWMNYVWGGTIAEFIVETFGMEYLVTKNRVHGDYEGIFGISRTEFEHQWHQWLRITFTQ